MAEDVLIDRAFVRIDEGLVHYRHCGAAQDGQLPLYMMHASPSSSISLEGYMKQLGQHRHCIAPDTLGNGDSCPQGREDVDMVYLADSVQRIFDALDIDKADVYGSHTGSHIACELAIAVPDRVNKLVFDGIGMFTPEDRVDFLANYAPEKAPDAYGEYLMWAWHFVRDQFLYFPHFRKTKEFQRHGDMASPEILHMIVMDVLKGLKTYHRNYHAAFKHMDLERLPLITHKTLVIALDSDPLQDGVNRAADLLPNGERAIAHDGIAPSGLHHGVEVILDFLNSD